VRRSTDPAAGAALVDFPCACATARRAARVLTQLYDGHLRASEIEATQFSLLALLSSLGPCSTGRDRRALRTGQNDAVKNLKLLKTKGWIESTEPEDRRQRCYVLTPAESGSRPRGPRGDGRRSTSVRR
jgi:hypothetical protein